MHSVSPSKSPHAIYCCVSGHSPSALLPSRSVSACGMLLLAQPQQNGRPRSINPTLCAGVGAAPSSHPVSASAARTAIARAEARDQSGISQQRMQGNGRGGNCAA